MFKIIRYKVAIYLLKRASECVKKGDFKNIMKGLKYMKYSLHIVPYTKEMSDLVNNMRRTAEDHQ